MSDLTMAKVRALYDDMVVIEKNMKTMESKMRMDMARLEKQSSEPRAAGSNSMPLVAVVSLVTFILGLACALAFSRPWWVSLALVLPGLAFLFLTWIWIAKYQVDRPAARERSQGYKWTEERFAAACSKHSPREWGACRDVLLGGMSIESAATKNKMFPAQVQRLVEQMNNS